MKIICESEPFNINIIGWCTRDGKKALLCDNGFTITTNDGAIERIIEKQREKGEEFPEFFWNGRSWQEKEA